MLLRTVGRALSELCCPTTRICCIIKISSVSQEERSISWDVSISVSLSKKLCMYMCLIPNGFRDRDISLYSSMDLAPNIALPSRMLIGVKRQLAVVTVDSDIVGVL
jgi:hypothetical protein